MTPIYKDMRFTLYTKMNAHYCEPIDIAYFKVVASFIRSKHAHRVWTRVVHSFRKWFNTDQAKSHYLNQWWPSLLPRMGGTRPQWVKIACSCLFLPFHHEYGNVFFLVFCELHPPVTDEFPSQGTCSARFCVVCYRSLVSISSRPQVNSLMREDLTTANQITAKLCVTCRETQWRTYLRYCTILRIVGFEIS